MLTLSLESFVFRVPANLWSSCQQVTVIPAKVLGSPGLHELSLAYNSILATRACIAVHLATSC